MSIDLNLTKNLDSDQLNAVLSDSRQLLVMANAGAGKTRMLTFRAANFIAQESGFTQHNIMMLTFTKKAANEMHERIAKLLGDQNLKIMAGTFHSIASRLIRQYSNYAGIDGRFSIFDIDASKLWLRTAITAILEEHPDWKKLKNRPTAEFIQKEYSRARNTDLDYRTVFAENYDDPEDPRAEICIDAVSRYENAKRSVPALDFDDLLTTFEHMLRNIKFRQIVQQRFPAVFVDEYQDINVIQHRIIQHLTGENTYLTLVGDDAQCIYGFRGSNVKFIMEFTKNFPNGNVLFLPKNYRSSKQIVETAADTLNSSEYKQGNPKTMTAMRQDTCPEIKCVILQDERHQAVYIRDRCLEAKPRMKWADMAILVRTKTEANEIEKVLLKAGIPVSKECGIEFYDREQIKMVVKYLQFLHLPNDKSALMAFMHKCPHVGAKTVDKMFDALIASNHDLTAMSKIKPPGKEENIYFTAIMDAFKTAQDMMSTGCMEPKVLAEDFIENFLYPWCKKVRYTGDASEELPARLLEIEELIDQLAIYPDLDTFLDNALLDTSMDEQKDTQAAQDGKVRIMTIHKSKGLEFKKVFLPSMSQGLTPSMKQIGIISEMQEELRVVYVAMTRAMDELDIMAIKQSTRLRYQMDAPAILEPSEFFKNLDFEEISYSGQVQNRAKYPVFQKN